MNGWMDQEWMVRGGQGERQQSEENKTNPQPPFVRSCQKNTWWRAVFSCYLTPGDITVLSWVGSAENNF